MKHQLRRAAVLVLAVSSAAGAQDSGEPDRPARREQSAATPVFNEVRFHRIHLRNENFIDGDLVGEDDKEVWLKVKHGELAVRRDQIARDPGGGLWIEYMRIRSLTPDPEPPEQDGRRPTDEARVPPPRPPAIPSPPVSPAPSAAGAPDSAKGRVDRLIEKLAKAPAEARQEVLQELVSTGKEGIPHLARLVGTVESGLRSSAADALISIDDPSCIPAVSNLLSHRDPEVRFEAVRILRALEDRSAAAPLLGSLSDKDPRVRTAAIEALETLDDADSFGPVASLLADPDAGVRAGAIEATFAMANRHNLGEPLERSVQAAVERGRDEAKIDILLAIGTQGMEVLANLVESCLTNPAPEVRAAAVTALGNLEVAKSHGAILELLQAEVDPLVQAQLAETARKLKLRDAIPTLLEWIVQGDLETREGSIDALRSLTGQDFGTDVQKWKEWWSRTKPKP